FRGLGHYLVYGLLIDHDSKARPVPRLLERWEYLDDGRRLRLTLRRGVQFQDGTLATADDVIYTLDQIARAENESPYAGDFAAVKSTQRIDDFTVELTTSQPAYHLVDVLQFGVLPRHILDGQPLQGNPFNRAPIGAGPYRVKALAPDRLELEANKGYFEGAPAIENLVVLAYDADELWRRLLARQIDFALAVPWSKERFLHRLSTVRLDQSSRIMGLGLMFTKRSAPFRD